ncbi:MAG: hypothetical protein B7Y05_07570 [Polynucleobacter sp. 24-46-87]|jgi:hypothetical protein|nr:MAG: hypothetical protein B7Y55_01195 [Polynucleobacter sp. 35-46-207]OZA14318.1 MAG: hypothetical protein B7Y05_07570 [Polynucleobacter sp. 24-46-87]OZB48930.1 MAG: hypothetical protein B7X60_02715 [Polynucleobacter sp. 39-45-136]
MKKPKIIISALLAMCGIAIFNFAIAQHGHGHGTSSTDTRVAVEYPPAMKEHTLTSMRDHLLAISQIQEAMGNGQYDKAAEIAETRLGQTALKTHNAYENSKFMPKGMQDIGNQMHRGASKFAIEVQNSGATGDTKLALLALSKTTQACVACHAGYKLK